MLTQRSVQPRGAATSYRIVVLPVRLLLVCLACVLALLVVWPVSAAFLTFVEVLRDGVNGVDGLNGVTSMAISPDGKYIYVASNVDSAVAVFSRNPTTGRLAFVDVKRADGVGGIPSLSSARAVTLSVDGKNVYVAGQGGGTVVVFTRDATTGGLTFVEVKQDGVGGVDGLAGAMSVVVSADGKHLYAVGSIDNAIAVFSRNSTTGALTFVEALRDSVGGVDGLAGATDVTISPDDKNVYVAARNDNAVAVFSRNLTTGALTFVEVKQNGVGGVSGLGFAQAVTVSPDNKQVYVAGINSVAVFSRSDTTGTLTFVEAQTDNTGGVDGLAGAADVIVSHSGSQVYVAGSVDDALAVFSRNATTGALTFIEAEKNGVGPVNGLDFIQSVAVSFDNQYIYTGSGLDDALAVFRAAVSTPQSIYQPLMMK